MKKIGFINANYPGEKRVAILPEDVKKIKKFAEIYVEEDYGKSVEIKDKDYKKAGCKIVKRAKIFDECTTISHLKCLQEEDYDNIKDGTTIIGWTHPMGSGKKCADYLLKKDILIVDLDNIYPNMFYKDKKISLLDYIPQNFVRENSVNAGRSSIIHAFVASGIYPDSSLNAAVLSAGNVSQGALEILTKFGCKTRVFTRNNLFQFQQEINKYDVIVNGIEFEQKSAPLIDKKLIKKVKKGAIIIDAAADAGAVIENMKFTTYENPFIDINGVKLWCINNIPSLFAKTSSKVISSSFSKYYDLDYRKILEENNK